jgi:hypothetical protein
VRRSSIHFINIAVLIILVIGLPAVASLRFGGVAFSSVEIRHLLVFWSAGIAAIANLVASRKVAKGKPGRRCCRDWAILYLALMGAEWLFHAGYLKFDWLKEWLLRLKG